MEYNDDLSPRLKHIKLSSGFSNKFSIGDAVAQAFQLFQAHPGTFVLLALVFIVSRVAWYFSHSLLHITVFPIFNVLYITGCLTIIRDLDTSGTTHFSRFFVGIYQFLLAFTVWILIWILISILPVIVLLVSYIPFYEALREGIDISPTFFLQDYKSLLVTILIFMIYFFFMGIIPYIGLTIQLFNPRLSIIKSIGYSLSLPFYNPKTIVKFSVLTILMYMTGLALVVGFYVVHVVFIALIYFIYKHGIISAMGHSVTPHRFDSTLDMEFNP